MKHTFLNNNESEAFCWNNYRLFKTVAAPLWPINTHFESPQEGDEPSLKILILILRQAPNFEPSSKYMRLTGNSSRQPNWKNQRQGRNTGSESESRLFCSNFVFKRNWAVFSHFSPFFLGWKYSVSTLISLSKNPGQRVGVWQLPSWKLHRSTGNTKKKKIKNNFCSFFSQSVEFGMHSSDKGVMRNPDNNFYKWMCCP